MTSDASLPVLLVILAMMAATVLTRTLGYFLIGFVRIGPRIEAAFRTLPGAVAAATIVPIIVTDGMSALAAVIASAILARRGLDDLIAVLGGLAAALVIRQAGG
jgi:uncharacterized membrane protein